MSIRTVPPFVQNGRTLYRSSRPASVVTLIVLSACAAHRPRIPQNAGPDVVTGSPATTIALLGTLHVSDPVRTLADSLLDARLRAACPSVTVLSVAETERRFSTHGVVAPRQLSPVFARSAREALGADLLLAPMTLGLTYDTRNTVAGIMDAIARPSQFAFDDRAGIALEGWDLRTAERTVRVVRTHASENSWTGQPEKLLQNATTDAVRRLAPLCAPDVRASASGNDASRSVPD